jgi:hypothetical protein
MKLGKLWALGPNAFNFGRLPRNRNGNLVVMVVCTFGLVTIGMIVGLSTCVCSFKMCQDVCRDLFRSSVLP